MHYCPRPLAIAIVPALAAVAAGLWAQPPVSTNPPMFSEVVDVRVVNLEVVVTDKKGNRVTGLLPQDFELRVDDRVVPIGYFSEVRDRASAARASEGAVPALAAEGPLRTSFLVFVDEFFSLTQDRDRVLERLRLQLDRLGPEDRMAIVRYDGHDLEMLTSWTGERERLDAALRAAQGRPSMGLQRSSELQQQRPGVRDSSLDGSLGPSGQLGIEERYFVGRLTEQVERVVAAAAATLRGFAAPPGRKVMLLLAGGWPYDPAEYVLDDPTRPITDTSVRRGPDLLSRLTDTANLLGYTLFPVDVPGMQARSSDAESNRVDGEIESLTSRSFVRENDLQATLYHLAKSTGGVALINRRRDEVLAAVLDDTQSFYWLGFDPERLRDDQRHRVRVRVLRPGLEARTRQDYFDFSRQREVTMMVESALQFGAPPSAEPLAVRLGRGERSGARSMTVPVSVGIPADAITLLPGPGGFSVQVELRIAVLDKDGATADTPVIPLSFTLAERPAPGTILRYDTALKMRRKAHDLVVAVYDIPSGAILSSALEVAP